MNINKIPERPKRLFSKSPHLKVIHSSSGAFNSPGLSTPNPEERFFSTIKKIRNKGSMVGKNEKRK